MSTYSTTNSSTFTIVHARHIASKIAADMHLCQAYYGLPGDQHLANISEELAQLLKDGYVKEFEFGFEEKEERVVAWRYTVNHDGTITTDDRPGKVYSSADVSKATFYNILTRSDKWWKLEPRERDRIAESLPIKRSPRDMPGDGAGHWVHDKNYSSSSCGTSRSSFKPY